MRILFCRTLTAAEQVVNQRFEALNAAGDVQADALGVKQGVDTLTAFAKKIVEQKFFTFPIADYVPMDVGFGAWLKNIEQAREYAIGGSFYEGDMSDHAGEGKIAEVTAGLDMVSIPVQSWAKKISTTTFQIQAAQKGAIGWDELTAKIRSLKKNWDLGIQENAMLGHKINRKIPGLLTNQEATSVTNLITVPLSSMTQAQMQAFISQVLTVYRQNCENTAYPNMFVVPESDWNGLGNPFPQSVAQITILEYLTKMFKDMTMNQNFKILPMAYANAANMAKRGENLNRYALYNYDTDSLVFNIPVDFNIISGLIVDGITFPQTAIGQYSGVLVKRVPELLYLDRA
jgi:hypothetical protein